MAAGQTDGPKYRRSKSKAGNGIDNAAGKEIASKAKCFAP
jgi:hypothetical protein